MCPNIVELKYQGHRYDQKTYEELVKFDETGIVGEIPLGDERYDKNICYYNRTRISVNKDVSDEKTKNMRR